MKKLCKACKILMVFVMCFGAILLANNVFAAKNFGPTPIILHECEAGSWQNYNEGYHVKKCTVTGCGEIMETASHNNKLTWTGTTHTKTCNDCGGKYTRNHTYNKETGKCTGCQYVCVHSNCEIKYNSNNHWEECSICHFKKSENSHSVRDGRCTKPGCGYKCEHSNYDIKYNDNNHWEECSICGFKRLEDSHSIKDGECTKSGCHYKCEHINFEWETTDTAHMKICTVCNGIIEYGNHEDALMMTPSAHTEACKICGRVVYAEKHTYDRETGKCTDCQYICDHEYEIGECKVCGFKCKHRYNSQGLCSLCEVSCNHSYNSYGVCKLCGTRASNLCKHVNWQWEQSKEKHRKECKECGEKLTTEENHQYDDSSSICQICEYECKHTNSRISFYENYSIIRHTIYCPDCKREFKEAHGKSESCNICNASCNKGHTYNSEGKCSVCGDCEHISTKIENISDKEHQQRCLICMKILRKVEHKYSSSGKCSCGAECPHSNYEWRYTDTNVHTKTCTGCGRKGQTGEHIYNGTSGICVECSGFCRHSNTSIEKISNKEHNKRCLVCNKILNTGEHQYNERKECTECGYECIHVYIWKEVNSNEHAKECTDCGKVELTEEHKYNKEQICEVCKYECKHERKWEVDYNIQNNLTHTVEEYCLCGARRTLDPERHDFTKEGVCTKCEYKCKHTWKLEYSSDEYIHTQKEVCSCGVERILETGEHEFNDNGVCTVCAYSTYVKCIVYKYNHKWEVKSVKVDNGGAGHIISEFCECGEMRTRGPESHSYNDEGICTACKQKRPHDYDKETKRCKICQAPCEHILTQYISLTDSEHQVQCVHCETIIGTEEHQHNEDGICKCNHKICVHKNYEWKWIGRTHEKICSNCKEKLEVGNHIYDEYGRSCMVCKYGCHHKYSNGVCDLCGYICEHKNSYNGKCSTCLYEHEHKYLNGVCQLCEYKCRHMYNEQEKCKLCGYVEECKTGIPHAYKTSYEYYTEDLHKVVNKCSYCAKSYVVGNEKHRLDHNNCCSLCSGANGCKRGYPHAYSYSYEYLSSTLHTLKVKCLTCGEETSHKKSHEFNDEGMCEKCGYRVICEFEHPYTEYIEYSSKTEHEIINRCEYCGDTQTTLEEHEYVIEGYESISHDTHNVIKKCNVCGATVTEEANHEYEESKCKDCGYNKCSHGRKAEYKYVSPIYHEKIEKCDGWFCKSSLTTTEKHTFNENRVCDCGYMTYGSECINGGDHIYVKDYRWVTDTAHIIVDKCTKCGDSHTIGQDTHEISSIDGKCIDCGY